MNIVFVWSKGQETSSFHNNIQYRIIQDGKDYWWLRMVITRHPIFKTKE